MFTKVGNFLYLIKIKIKFIANIRNELNVDMLKYNLLSSCNITVFQMRLLCNTSNKNLIVCNLLKQLLAVMQKKTSNLSLYVFMTLKS